MQYVGLSHELFKILIVRLVIENAGLMIGF